MLPKTISGTAQSGLLRAVTMQSEPATRYGLMPATSVTVATASPPFRSFDLSDGAGETASYS